MLFDDLDDATRRQAIAFLEASLNDDTTEPRRKVLHLSHPSARRVLRLESSEPCSIKRVA